MKECGGIYTVEAVAQTAERATGERMVGVRRKGAMSCHLLDAGKPHGRLSGLTTTRSLRDGETLVSIVMEVHLPGLLVRCLLAGLQPDSGDMADGGAIDLPARCPCGACSREGPACPVCQKPDV